MKTYIIFLIKEPNHSSITIVGRASDAEEMDEETRP
jgi:hypothetical protein